MRKSMSLSGSYGTLLVREGVWCAVDVIVYFFAVVCQSVSCTFVGCFAMVIDYV